VLNSIETKDQQISVFVSPLASLTIITGLKDLAITIIACDKKTHVRDASSVVLTTASFLNLGAVFKQKLSLIIF